MECTFGVDYFCRLSLFTKPLILFEVVGLEFEIFRLEVDVCRTLGGLILVR
jgi:hypothetical protein